MSAQVDEQAIRSLEDRRFQAMISADTATLKQLLAEDLVYTHSNTSVDTKESLIQSIETRRPYQNVERTEERIRIYDSSAVVTGQAQISLSGASGRRILNARYIDVWVNGPGGWQMVAWQSTPIPA